MERMVVMGKLYYNGYATYHIVDIYLSCQLVPASKLVFVHINILQHDYETQK